MNDDPCRDGNQPLDALVQLAGLHGLRDLTIPPQTPPKGSHSEEVTVEPLSDLIEVVFKEQCGGAFFSDLQATD